MGRIFRNRSRACSRDPSKRLHSLAFLPSAAGTKREWFHSGLYYSSNCTGRRLFDRARSMDRYRVCVAREIGRPHPFRDPVELCVREDARASLAFLNPARHALGVFPSAVDEHGITDDEHAKVFDFDLHHFPAVIAHEARPVVVVVVIVHRYVPSLATSPGRGSMRVNAISGQDDPAAHAACLVNRYTPIALA